MSRTQELIDDDDDDMEKDDILDSDEIEEYDLTLSSAMTNYSTQWKTNLSTEHVNALAAAVQNEIRIRERLAVQE